MKRLILIISLMLVSVYALPVFGYQASSTNYRIERDSINIGGDLSTSTNYSLEDTVGDTGTGTSSSATYKLKAGYQQMAETIIAITTPDDISLTPNIESAGGVANGSASWTVTTNNSAGYTLRIEADTSPAMKFSGGSFANYTPSAVVPDFAWSVVSTEKEFGFSPEGLDIVSTYRDDGSANCSSGTNDTSLACWDSILTSSKLISSTSTQNQTFGGTSTSVHFRAEAGSGSNPTEGSYIATLTLTAVTQ